MDLSQLPEKDRQKMVQYIEEKQVKNSSFFLSFFINFFIIIKSKQFMSLYSFLVTRCFDDCVNDFTSDTLSVKESECARRCTAKMLKVTNRIGQQMAEKQMTTSSVSPTTPTTPSLAPLNNMKQ